MPLTSRMKWSLPTEDADPWYAAIVALFGEVDASVYASREDRNLILMGGGNITWTLGSHTLSWSEPLRIISPIAGLLCIIEAGSAVLDSDGRMLYAPVVRYPQDGNKTITAAVGSQVPTATNPNDQILFAVRYGDLIYWRNGLVLANGQTIVNFQAGFTAGGDLASVPVDQTVIGIQGNPVDNAAPAVGQVLKWSGAAWVPAADAAGTSHTLVWRPTEPAPSGNVFADWDLLYATFLTLEGHVFIVIDTSLTVGLGYPGGVADFPNTQAPTGYDMQGRAWFIGHEPRSDITLRPVCTCTTLLDGHVLFVQAAGVAWLQWEVQPLVEVLSPALIFDQFDPLEGPSVALVVDCVRVYRNPLALFGVSAWLYGERVLLRGDSFFDDPTDPMSAHLVVVGASSGVFMDEHCEIETGVVTGSGNIYPSCPNTVDPVQAFGWMGSIVPPGCAGGGAASLIWRPSEPSPEGNVYADWDLLYAAFLDIDGPVTIVLDDSLAPCAFPVSPMGGVAPYDMQGRAWFEGYITTADKTARVVCYATPPAGPVFGSSYVLFQDVPGMRWLQWRLPNEVLGVEGNIPAIIVSNEGKGDLPETALVLDCVRVYDHYEVTQGIFYFGRQCIMRGDSIFEQPVGLTNAGHAWGIESNARLLMDEHCEVQDNTLKNIIDVYMSCPNTVSSTQFGWIGTIVQAACASGGGTALPEYLNEADRTADLRVMNGKDYEWTKLFATWPDEPYVLAASYNNVAQFWQDSSDHTADVGLADQYWFQDLCTMQATIRGIQSSPNGDLFAVALTVPPGAGPLTNGFSGIVVVQASTTRIVGWGYIDTVTYGQAWDVCTDGSYFYALTRDTAGVIPSSVHKWSIVELAGAEPYQRPSQSIWNTGLGYQSTICIDDTGANLFIAGATPGMGTPEPMFQITAATMVTAAGPVIPLNGMHMIVWYDGDGGGIPSVWGTYKTVAGVGVSWFMPITLAETPVASGGAGPITRADCAVGPDTSDFMRRLWVCGQANTVEWYNLPAAAYGGSVATPGFSPAHLAAHISMPIFICEAYGNALAKITPDTNAYVSPQDLSGDVPYWGARVNDRMAPAPWVVNLNGVYSGLVVPTVFEPPMYTGGFDHLIKFIRVIRRTAGAAGSTDIQVKFTPNPGGGAPIWTNVFAGSPQPSITAAQGNLVGGQWNQMDNRTIPANSIVEIELTSVETVSAADLRVEIHFGIPDICVGGE